MTDKPFTLIIEHSPWMYRFPILIFLSALISTFSGVFVSSAAVCLFLFYFFTATLFLCLLEPLGHSIWLFLKLLLLHETVLGIIIFPIWRTWKYFSDTCYIDQGRLVLSSGVFRFTKLDIPVEAISKVDMKHGIFGKHLAYGDLLFYLKDGSCYPYRYILEPKSMQQKIMEYISGVESCS